MQNARELASFKQGITTDTSSSGLLAREANVCGSAFTIVVMLSIHHIPADARFHALAVADVAKQACLSAARRE
jgi:hypothetical protein